MGSFLSGFLSIFAIVFILLPSLSINLADRESSDLRGGKEEAYAMIYPSPSPSLRPTSAPSPTLVPSVTGKPVSTSLPPSPQTSLGETSNLLSEVNAFRAQNGLSPVSANNETCSFAAIRASEISSNFNHDGFRNRLDTKTLPYPSYSQVVENIAMNSNPLEVVKKWIESSGHAENMKKDTPFACIAQNGNYFVYEGWKP